MKWKPTKTTRTGNPNAKGSKVEDPPQEEPTVSSQGRKTAGQRLFLICPTPRLVEANLQGFAPEAKDKTTMSIANNNRKRNKANGLKYCHNPNNISILTKNKKLIRRMADTTILHFKF